MLPLSTDGRQVEKSTGGPGNELREEYLTLPYPDMPFIVTDGGEPIARFEDLRDAERFCFAVVTPEEFIFDIWMEVEDGGYRYVETIA